MKTLIEQIKTQDSYAQFNSIPVCVPAQASRESEGYFQARNGKIKKGTRRALGYTQGVF